VNTFPSSTKGCRDRVRMVVGMELQLPMQSVLALITTDIVYSINIM